MRRAGPLNSQAGSACRDLGTSVKHTKNQLRNYPGIAMPGSRPAGMKIYHVIAIAGPTLSRH